MLKQSLLFLSVLAPFILFAQSPIYEFRDLDVGNHIPEDLNSDRSAVFINAKKLNGEYDKEGESLDPNYWNVHHHGCFRLSVMEIYRFARCFLKISRGSRSNDSRMFHFLFVKEE